MNFWQIEVSYVIHCIAFVRTKWYKLLYQEALFMAKTANITIRVDPETKASAEQLFSTFGITITDAISIFLHKSIMEGGLPFEVKHPRFNAETEMAIEEARRIIAGKTPAKRYGSARELFNELDTEMTAKL